MTADAGSTPEPDSSRREIEIDGATWVAEITGRCAVGGALGSVAIEAIQFRHRDASGVAARLAYAPHGDLERLRDDELRRLHGIARPVAPGSTDDQAAKR